MADIASPFALARQAIAAAKTAADEGEAILRHTQERYRLKLHPAEAQAERPRSPKPKLIIKPELPEYVLTAADRVNVAAVVAMMKTVQAAKARACVRPPIAMSGSTSTNCATTATKPSWPPSCGTSAGCPSRAPTSL
jgi:hypothetical protein